MDILDTNILLHYVWQNPLAEETERRYALMTANPAPLISIVSEGELRSLALQLAWGARRRQRLENLLNFFRIIPLPFSTVVDAYAKIDDYCRRNGFVLGKNDLWIAAAAHVTGARLLTTDKDFDPLHGVFLQHNWVDPVI